MNYFVAGPGPMRLGADAATVTTGDCVVIAPGVPPQLCNTGADRPVALGGGAPADGNDDTAMTGG
jgi:mannose-6-phosphate isomerase-like protein (cupin superfamily)